METGVGEMVSGYRGCLSPGTDGFWEGCPGFMAGGEPMLASEVAVLCSPSPSPLLACPPLGLLARALSLA